MLTLAKEKLILIGTVKEATEELEKWLDARGHSEWLLPDHGRARESCYLDCIAPSLYRHRDRERLLELGQGSMPDESDGYDQVTFGPEHLVIWTVVQRPYGETVMVKCFLD